jgi:hypothetical protein
LDVGKVQLGFQTAAAEVGLKKAALTSGVYENIYGANKENIAASYAAQQAVGQGVSDIGKATSGALMGYSGAVSGMGGMGGMGGGGGGSSSNPYYGSLGTGYGSQPIQFQSRADYASQVSNPSTQYLGGQSRLDTMTDTYSGPRLKNPY